MAREGLMDDCGYNFEEREFPSYFDFDYEEEVYFEVSGPSHDHYTYSYNENSWFENILFNDKCYNYKNYKEALKEWRVQDQEKNV